jgi:E3 ubiquitin-protein ligase RGLG
MSGRPQVLQAYGRTAAQVTLMGPTTFAPLIRKAIDIVRETKTFHVLLIIADGQVDNKQDTIDAIVDASQHPLSIVMIGVGDGPWEMMQEFDDELPERQFDNFQFVCLTDILQVN